MRAYRVVRGPVQIGPGEMAGLTDAQYSPRAHRVDVHELRDGLHVCRFAGVVEFKAGEVLHIEEPPAKALAERLLPVSGGDDAGPRLSRAPRAARRRARIAAGAGG